MTNADKDKAHNVIKTNYTHTFQQKAWLGSAKNIKIKDDHRNFALDSQCPHVRT